MSMLRINRHFFRVARSQTKFLSSASHTVPQFIVTPQNGFLPRQDPLVRLPSQFAALESLMQNMPIKKEDGTPGLLAQQKLFEASAAVPEYKKEVESITDTHLLNALFRDYTFWASAYLLEPCHHNMLKSGDNYGLGRATLPRNIAVPLCIISEKLGARPFMEYAQSYALNNYQKVSQTGGMDYSNLRLIRTFSGSDSEAGFILIHVAMVANTPTLVSAAENTLQAVANKDRAAFNQHARTFQQTMSTINNVMENMWKASNPGHYKDFRTFIMGLKNQPMFPNGVVYEGVPGTDGADRAYRGESGANDSIIPTADNLFEVLGRMPENPLTEILREFRSYRPKEQNEWLADIQQGATRHGVMRFAMADPDSSLLYIENLDEIRAFRQRHWNFTKEYILKHTNHPVATGGSPIATWLPNQLLVVMRLMVEQLAAVQHQGLSPKKQETWKTLSVRVSNQEAILLREVQEIEEKLAKKA